MHIPYHAYVLQGGLLAFHSRVYKNQRPDQDTINTLPAAFQEVGMMTTEGGGLG